MRDRIQKIPIILNVLLAIETLKDDKLFPLKLRKYLSKKKVGISDCTLGHLLKTLERNDIIERSFEGRTNYIIIKNKKKFKKCLESSKTLFFLF